MKINMYRNPSCRETVILADQTPHPRFALHSSQSDAGATDARSREIKFPISCRWRPVREIVLQEAPVNVGLGDI